MNVIKREQLGKSNEDPLIFYDLELDPRIETQVEQIRTIVDTIVSSGLLSDITIIAISGDDYSLDFDTLAELLDYIGKYNMDDATGFILKSQYGWENLGFGFELRTNRMNVNFRRREESQVLRLIERIEAALLVG